MTRENKLALVVGFGLILFVGILISDHFSVVRTQRAADLNSQPRDPLLLTNPAEHANLIELKPLHEPPAPEVAPTQETVVPDSAMANIATTGIYDPRGLTSDVADTGSSMPDSSAQNIGVIAMRPTPRPNAGAVAPEGFVEVPGQGLSARSNPVNASADYRFHDVQTGESLYSISTQYFGNGNAIALIAQYNRIDDPDSLRIGQRIRIPNTSSESTAGETRAAATTNAVESQSPVRANRQESLAQPVNAGPSLRVVKETTIKPGTSLVRMQAGKNTAAKATYTVKKGETLRLIALKLMGSKNKWNRIYDMNRDVIDDPNNLQAGTVLRVS